MEGTMVSKMKFEMILSLLSCVDIKNCFIFKLDFGMPLFYKTYIFNHVFLQKCDRGYDFQADT